MNGQQSQERDELHEFYSWYVTRQGFMIPLAPHDGFNKVGKFTGLTVFREPPFQVQLWLCEPNSSLPEHVHPNVDTIQVYVCGEVFLKLNGVDVVRPEDVRRLENGITNLNGRAVRIRPADVHSITVGPLGAAFLNFQMYLNGVPPTSLENDWKGEPLDDEHRDRLRAR